MMTPDQWKQLAEFAGCSIKYFVEAQPNPIVHFAGSAPYVWRPDTDWSDFGPLLVLLLRWRKNKPALLKREISAALDKFADALDEGTDRDIMQAGCLLGAQIGATMNNPA